MMRLSVGIKTRNIWKWHLYNWSCHFWEDYTDSKKYSTSYYISPIEIGLVWVKITYLKIHSKSLNFNLQTDMKWIFQMWYLTLILVKKLQRYKRSKKISANQPGSNPCTRGRPSWQIFFSTSNIDLWYLCSPLIKINVWYLIWKIYFIAVRRRKPKAFKWLLRFIIPYFYIVL